MELQDSTASGSSSFAAGEAAVASGNSSISIGGYSDATGTNALAIGAGGTQSAGTNSVAIGYAYASGDTSFAASIGDYTSSYGATGDNSIAMGSLAKATSTYAVAIGYSAQSTSVGTVAIGAQNTASGQYSTAIGRSNTASGNYAAVIGSRDSTASADNSFASGQEAKATIRGQKVHASGQFATKGDAQGSIFILRADTTDATATVLTTNNSTASTDNQIVLQNESAMSFTGTVVVREDASDGDDYAGWEIKGVIMRQGQASDTTLGVGIVNSLYHTSGLANAAVALSADTTNGGLKIQVTGIASTNLNWVATVHTSEVVNA